MNMKTLLYTLLFALLPLAAVADDVRLTRPTLTLEEDTLTMSFDIDLSAVRVNSEQSYAFTPCLRGDDGFRALAPVIVTGRKGEYKMRRKERRMARRHGFDSPYAVIHGRTDERPFHVSYTASMPYEEWMGQASVVLLQEGRECYEAHPELTVIEPEPEVVVLPLPAPGEVCEPCMQMVTFLAPKEEPLKVRSEQSTLYVEYPVGKTVFDPAYRSNAAEMQKLKAILNPLTEGDLVTFKSIRVTGYASPDGSVRTNERVSAQRAESFALNLKGSYNFPQEILEVESAGEDWDGLVRMLEEERPAYAGKALEVIGKYDNLDVREARLKSALGAATYRKMLDTCYPRLRRLGVEVDYEVREVANEEAAQLIYTEPKMLSLQEMYRVAKTLAPGTEEYRRVYEIAAQTYPDDVVACINAASANIVSGDFRKAAEYLERVKDDARAWNDLGVLEWLAGNFENARAWFDRAMVAEPEKAKANLEAIKAYEPAAE